MTFRCFHFPQQKFLNTQDLLNTTLGAKFVLKCIMAMSIPNLSRDRLST